MVSINEQLQLSHWRHIECQPCACWHQALIQWSHPVALLPHQVRKGILGDIILVHSHRADGCDSDTDSTTPWGNAGKLYAVLLAYINGLMTKNNAVTEVCVCPCGMLFITWQCDSSSMNIVKFHLADGGDDANSNRDIASLLNICTVTFTFSNMHIIAEVEKKKKLRYTDNKQVIITFTPFVEYQRVDISSWKMRCCFLNSFLISSSDPDIQGTLIVIFCKQI